MRHRDRPPPLPQPEPHPCPSGADPGGGGAGPGGQEPPPPPPPTLLGDPQTLYRGKKTSRVCTRMGRILVLNSYADPPFPKSCIRPCPYNPKKYNKEEENDEERGKIESNEFNLSFKKCNNIHVVSSRQPAERWYFFFF